MPLLRVPQGRVLDARWGDVVDGRMAHAFYHRWVAIRVAVVLRNFTNCHAHSAIPAWQ